MSSDVDETTVQRSTVAAADHDFHVSELVSDVAGAHSPFGNLVFPLPTEQLTYTHPGPENRPHLAEGR